MIDIFVDQENSYKAHKYILRINEVYIYAFYL